MSCIKKRVCVNMMERVCLLMSVMKTGRNAGYRVWGTLGAVDDGVETAETQRPYNCQKAGADGPAASPGPAIGERLDVH